MQNRFSNSHPVEALRDRARLSEKKIRLALVGRSRWLQETIAEREKGGRATSFFVEELAAIEQTLEAPHGMLDAPHGVCSFCGKAGADVKYVIQGPVVTICDECVFVAVEILAGLGISTPMASALPLIDEER
jgi:ClpX C4-type zinc finger